MDILSMCGLYDPYSTKGLRIEGGIANSNGVRREDNPYSKECPGALAETHWFEGWDSYAAFKAKGEAA